MKTSIEPKAESGHCGTRERPTVIGGPVLTLTGNPFKSGLEHTAVYEPDAIVVMAGGLITDFGQAQLVLPKLPAGTEVKNYGKDALISTGFIDSHVHFPQTPMIAAYGEQLLDWLTNYTFPTELKYANKEFARSVAQVFLQENLRNGITSACVYCTVHPQSVDALFVEAEKLGMRLAAGKVLMDRNGRAARYAEDWLRLFQDADCEVAQSRAPHVCRHAAVCPNQHARATGSCGSALQGASRVLSADSCFRKQGRDRLGQAAVCRAQRLSRCVRSLLIVPAACDLWPWHLSDGRRDAAHARHRLGDRSLPNFQFFPWQRLLQYQASHA
jgi:Amidohydrolase family